MAEAALSFVLQQLYLLGSEEISLLKGLGNDFPNIQHELESIYAFLKDADRKAGYEGDTNYRIKTWVKQVREVSFCIEDVIDKYIMYVARYNRIDSLPKIAQQTKTLLSRRRIASEIRNIKSSVQEIKERSTRYDFESSSNSSREAEADPRMDAHFMEETGVVGFESPRDELIDFLTQGTQQLSAISVVGMGGLGKTTLAKQVFDNPHVQEHFKCTCFLTVSQSYTVKELLVNMVKKFCEDYNDPLPQGLHEKDDNSLVTQVRKFLESNKYMYLLLFDDVWKQDFSDEIKHALPDNNNGSRIVITTRTMHVAECFNKSFLGRVHELQHLPLKKALELFCKKAFKFEPSHQCPPELKEMSEEIVQKCGGLPLAIVAIGGLLTTKAKEMIEWRKVCEDLTMEIERTPYLNALTRILSLSYDDLPPNLKSCMLYFGMYPEHYSIKYTRLTRQWIAEGFIQNEGKRPVEEVAERSLRDLAHRSLVKVSKVGRNGKVKSCQVHDLLRKVIIRRMKELNFCHVMHEDDELETVGITRRFSVANFSDIVLSRTRLFGVRAIFIFSKSELPAYFVPKLSTKFKLLKVLDFQGTLLNHVPDNLGKLFLLRYLNLSHTQVEVLPKSIGKLLNLETLDLRQTKVRELPREITQLLKLRLLSVYYRKIEGKYSVLESTTGAKMHKGIRCLKSLQKLYFLEAYHGGLDLVEELKMLKQLRKLGIRCVRREYATALSAAIGGMNHLESLNVSAVAEDEIIDLNFKSDPPQLQVLKLNARVTKLPDWIPKLAYLVKLRLGLSNLKEDPLDSLKVLPNLMLLSIWDNAYEGESLHFKKDGFPKLKELDLTRLSRLSSMSIDKGALLGLEHLSFRDNPQMKVLPCGLDHLKNLQFLGFVDMPTELEESIDPAKDGRHYGVIKHITSVSIRYNVHGPRFHPNHS